MHRRVLAALAAAFLLHMGMFLVHGLVLFEQWKGFMTGIGKALDHSALMIAAFAVIELIRGVLIAGLAQGIRTRVACPYGTTIMTGFASWAVISLLPRLGEAPVGVYPIGLLAAAAGLEAIPCFLAAAAAVAILPAPQAEPSPALGV